jgi:hypothetical protein
MFPFAAPGAERVTLESASPALQAGIANHAPGDIGAVDLIEQAGAGFDDPSAMIAALDRYDLAQVQSLENCGYEIALQAGRLVVCRDGHRVGDFPRTGQ